MAFLHAMTLLVSFLCLLFPQAIEAQFYQDYMPDTTRPGNFLYRSVPGVNPWQVMNIEPYTVYLIYNCYYMREVCRNAEIFSASTRGQNPHPQSGIANDVYGYDLDTGDAPSGSPRSHQESRRAASCPGSWSGSHTCPEADGSQRRPMKQDGEWFTTSLEPGTSMNNLMNRRDSNNNIIAYSNIRYTCDEFPPATWVEGGNGWTQTSPSNTRCAALACSNHGEPLVKAEQNWQGLSHGALRLELELRAQNLPGFNPAQSIILFRFRADNDGADGVAARIYVIEDIGNADQVVDDVYINQYKRTAAANSTMTGPGLTAEELRTYVKIGKGYETLVHENLTISKPDSLGRSKHMPSGPEIPSTGHPYSWDVVDEMNKQQLSENRTLHRSLLKKPETVQRRSVPLENVTPLLKTSTSADLQAARRIVDKAWAESQKRNKARVTNPLRNRYPPRSGSTVSSNSKMRRNKRIARTSVDKDLHPLLEITPDIVAAAALVAEADMQGKSGNVTKRATAAAGTYWMQGLDRKGSVPWGDDPSYKIFRNVLDFGAVGDGVTDDTKAINKAMGTNSTRCGKGCNGSTTKNAIVYFPPGKYLVSSTIALPFGTQVIGDANNRPTIVAAPSFVGLGVLSTDEYTGEGGAGIDGKDPEYYVNTANFYRQIRNIIIDVRPVKTGAVITCLHYQVAQATSTQNVELIAQAGTEQIGMFAENGSGGGISDVTFTGGGIGLKGGEQQFTAQRLTFNGCDVGVQVIWDWGWVWKSITMNNVGTGFKLVGDDGVGDIGSVSVLDSSFTDVSKMIVVNPIKTAPGQGSTGMSLENIALSGVGVAVADTSGATLLASSSLIDQWVVGPVYEGSTTARSFSKGGKVGNYRRHSTLLDGKGNYFERERPQYEDLPVSSFMHTKNLGCAGDGSTDDTAAFQAALYASVGKVLFVDAGTYILTSTVTIPSGVKIVGETWSQLAASGSYFSDASNPKVMLKVGKEGDVGNVEMQDLIFTTHGPTAGAVLVQWNIQAESAGAAGLWDCHVRIGGASGTKLTPTECPPVTSGIDPGCSAASLMMHLTKSGSGYFENMWLWGADHMIDDPDSKDSKNDMEQTSIYIARGFLIESTKPTWLYGTASEHAVFYQYNFHSASNIYAGMLQTESPYFQPTPQPPAPFTDVVGKFPGDPDYTCAKGDDFSGCDESWSTIITGSENIFISAAGIYSWFSTYAQDCIDTQQCQKALMYLKNNFANVRITNLVTIGSKYMAVMDGKGIPAADNLNVDVHPYWSQISVLDVGSNGTTNFDEYVWIDPKIWQMEQPQFTCSPPCNVKIPPWKGATSTVNYSLITVSQGTWTSTITHPPLTISEWVFEPVTLTQGANNKARRAADAVWPTPATTPFWPAVIYKGADGKSTTTSATGSFPKPPKSIGPNAAAPPSGSWPKRAIQPIFGIPEGPTVQECAFLDFQDPLCINKPWFWGNASDPSDPGDIENTEDSKTRCPASKSTSTTTSKTEPTRPATPSQYIQGDARTNSVKCYNSGENTEGARMHNAARSFCGIISNDDLGPGYFKSKDFPFDWNGGIGSVTITVSLEIKKGCSFGIMSALSRRDLQGRANSDFDETLCEKYLSVPTDSCNCSGVDGKQGGVVENNCYKWRIDPNLSF